MPLQGVQLWSVARGIDIFLGAALRSRESLLSCVARIENQCAARWPLEAFGSLWFYVLNVAPLAGTLATKSYVSVCLHFEASIRQSAISGVPPPWLSGRVGMPSEAKAKEAAAKAKAQAAAAGKAEVHAKTMAKGAVATAKATAQRMLP